MPRQAESGSHHLLLHLLAKSRLDAGELDWLARPALAETDLAATIRDGLADAGVAIEAAARAQGLTFIPLAVERLDLVLHRLGIENIALAGITTDVCDYFEPPVQALLTFLRTREFAVQAAALGGYDVTATGRVVCNG